MVSIVKAFALTWQVFVPKYLGSLFVQLVISSLSQIEEKNYEVIFVPYHVTMLSFKNLWSLLDFLKFKIQDSKQYHNLHHAINFQAIHLSCCISKERIWSNILLSWSSDKLYMQSKRIIPPYQCTAWYIKSSARHEQTGSILCSSWCSTTTRQCSWRVTLASGDRGNWTVLGGR